MTRTSCRVLIFFRLGKVYAEVSHGAIQELYHGSIRAFASIRDVAPFSIIQPTVSFIVSGGILQTCTALPGFILRAHGAVWFRLITLSYDR
jgi:hypothetical protein